ncbi:hypothetical protein SAMN05443637_104229 [Pseudonocardia thermophila]|jgi:hypothetical protein|uniref:Uncharacterized protein n=1 Tax=Pseudonocardia thermophila TaxID=1848 RepID=A0A1M6R7T2_PSETH|nr:hypothetical protein [Pseudonocardia thermophila]SHK28529.1 hypothetical protein SAMN05443637_104229 [Pseudonocardia thermophila]
MLRIVGIALAVVVGLWILFSVLGLLAKLLFWAVVLTAVVLLVAGTVAAVKKKRSGALR